MADMSQAAKEQAQPIVEGEDVTPDKDGGVLKIIKTEGIGDATPVAGDEVMVHYVGTLTDGTKFDSSRDRDQFFKFKLGKGKVIKAWDLGVATMKQGEVCKLTCRGDYAYGEAGSPPKIPPNATLVFEIELFNWNLQDLTKDGGAYMKVVQSSDNEYSTPDEGMEVEVHITGRHEGRVFEDRDVKFIVGDGDSVDVLRVIERAIRKLKVGEKAKVSVSSAYGYGQTGKIELGIPADAALEYDIELKWFEDDNAWEMDSAKRIETAQKYKSRGTDFFKANKLELASKQYSMIAVMLNDTKDLSDEQIVTVNQLRLAGYLNEAACSLKTKSFHDAESACKKAFEIDENSVKALYRTAQARMGMEDYRNAYKILQQLLQIEPSNKAAKQLAARVVHIIKQEKEKEKRRYNNMFQKFAEQDVRRQARQDTENVTKPNEEQNKDERKNSVESNSRDAGQDMEVEAGDGN